jgi:hypothetical protein
LVERLGSKIEDDAVEMGIERDCTSKKPSASADRPAKFSGTPTMLCPSAKFGLNAIARSPVVSASSIQRFHESVMASDHSA